MTLILSKDKVLATGSTVVRLSVSPRVGYLPEPLLMASSRPTSHYMAKKLHMNIVVNEEPDKQPREPCDPSAIIYRPKCAIFCQLIGLPVRCVTPIGRLGCSRRTKVKYRSGR
jgi:hypothetical protein